MINGKVYIGQTWNTLRKRFISHCSKNNDCILLGRAIQKHGKHNFTIHLITLASTQETADHWEKHFIKQYNSMDKKYGYNLKEGGSHGKPNAEARRKMSIAGKGRPKSEEWKKRASIRFSGENNPMYGRKLTDEENAKFARPGEQNGMYGKTHSEGARQKISEAHKDKPLSEEHKQNLSNALKDRPAPWMAKTKSEEFKKRVSETMKGKPTWNQLDTEIVKQIYDLFDLGWSKSKIGRHLDIAYITVARHLKKGFD